MKNIKKRNTKKNSQIVEIDKLAKSVELSKNSVCKIINGGKYGTGFFCNISSKHIKVLITNNHVLDQNFLDQEKTLYYLDGECIKKNINIEGDRFKYTDENLDCTIIEILEKEDKILHFLEGDENLDNYKNMQILIFQFPEGRGLSMAPGLITNQKANKIFYECSTDKGSSGSPLILADNRKVIGLHRGVYKDCNIREGIPIKLIINMIYSISCKYVIKNKNINKEIRIISDAYFEKNKDKKMLIEGKILPIKTKYKFDKEGEETIYFLLENDILNMEKMFLNCTFLSEIYFLNYKRSKMEGLSKMFNGCTSLKKVNLFAFDAFNEHDLSGMFEGCSSLEKINYILFNAFNAVNLSNLFKGCTSLKKIDLKSFKTYNVKKMLNMFEGCSSLEEIDLSSIKTNKVDDTSNMFKNCTSLKTINLSNNIFEEKINMNKMFYECSSLENIFFPSKKIESGKVVNHKNNKLNVISMSHIFYNCPKLLQIDLSIFNTENVEDMESILEGCSSLIKIDLSSFNANKVICMNNIFSECSLLEEIKMFDLIETNNLEYISKMFFNCSKLKDLYFPANFHTKNVIDMSEMFAGCSSLEELNFPNGFNTLNVRFMKKMFYRCSSLNKINLSSFYTENLQDCSFMFYECKAIINLNLSSFNTAKVSNMSFMFSECNSLQILNLSSFTNEKLQNISNMFKGCISLKEIDFSSFKIKTYKYCCCSIPEINFKNIFDDVPSSCKLICEDDELKDKFHKCLIF